MLHNLRNIYYDHCSQNEDELRKQGKTIVIISHKNSVLAATTKLLVLVDGKAQLFGPTAQVLDRLRKPRPQPVQPLQSR